MLLELVGGVLEDKVDSAVNGGGGVTDVLLAVVGWLNAWSMMRLAALTSNMGIGPKPAGGTEPPPHRPLLPLLLLVVSVVVVVLVAVEDKPLLPLSCDLVFRSPVFWRAPAVDGFFPAWHP